MISFLFFFTATNDCCLSEIEEEIQKITKVMHDEEDHSDDETTCEDCQCSNFCSYNLISHNERQELQDPESNFLLTSFAVFIDEEIKFSKTIFHPPIA